MEAMIQLYGGGQYALPPLLEWEVSLTGSIPCDSFQISCLYGKEMVEKLHNAWRIVLSEADFRFRAVVDEYEIRQDGTGRTLHIRGRGLAALLLDNESVAMEYRAPTLSEILKNHAGSCGISWEKFDELRSAASYVVSSGCSQWKALADFTRYVGGFEPRITPDGVLQVVPWKDNGKRRVMNEKTPVLSLSWRDQRYGIYSEVLVVDKTRQNTQSVVNEDFLKRGGRCRRVLYTPGKSTVAAMRYTGEYQIEKSQEDKRILTVTLPYIQMVRPGDVVQVNHFALAIVGAFFVQEVDMKCDGNGKETTLRMRRLEN